MLSATLKRLVDLASSYVGSKAKISLSAGDYAELCSASGTKPKTEDAAESRGRAVLLAAKDLCDAVDAAVAKAQAAGKPPATTTTKK